MKFWQIYGLNTIIIIAAVTFNMVLARLFTDQQVMTAAIFFMAGVVFAIGVQYFGRKQRMAEFETHLKAISEREKMKADAYLKEALDKIKKAREGTWIS